MTFTVKTALLCATGLSLMFAGSAHAQTSTDKDKMAPTQKPASAPADEAVVDDATEDAIVVTGFRASLEKGLDIKRNSIAVVDSIVAEDIGKFPTQNIAEALQRLPGVDLVRDEASNEGNRIQLRGLGPEFTLTTFNGAPVRTTSSANVGQSTRDFNYDIFPSELFSRADVYKTPLAELEEGGVAGVVNLRTPRPFDKSGNSFAYGLRGTYNDQSRYTTPSGFLLGTAKFGDFGITLGVSKSGNRTRRGGFESTGLFFNEQANIDYNGNSAFNSNFNPGGVAVTRAALQTPGAVINPPGGTAGIDTFRLDFRSPLANLGGYTVAQLRSALVPRLLRVTGTQNERDRIGAVGSIQFKNDTLDVSLDGIYAKLDDKFQRQILGFAPRGSTRYSLANGSPDIVAGSSTNIPAWVPLAPTIDENGILGGTFGNVTMQNAAVYRNSTTEFYNGSLNARYELSENWGVEGQIGYTKSTADAYAHTSILNSLSQLNTITYNISDPFNPTLSVARDVSNPLLNEQATLSGNFRREADTQKNARLIFDHKYEWGQVNGVFKIGASYVKSVKESSQNAYGNGNTVAGFPTGSPAVCNTFNPLVGATLPASQGGLRYCDSTSANQRLYFQSLLTPLNLSGFASDANGAFPASWLHVSRDTLDTLNADQAARNSLFVYNNYFKAAETIKAAFVSGSFETGAPENLLRGYVGFRYIDTGTSIDNYTARRVTPTFENPTGQGLINTQGGYKNFLTSASLAWNITDKLLTRVLYNSTLTRSSISNIARPVNIPNTGQSFVQKGNPDLKPQFADSFDLIGEWYFDKGGILSIGAFQKTIKDRPIARSEQILFSDLGLDASLFTSPLNTGSGVDPNLSFTVDTFVNLERYKIKGLEGAYQQQLRFLPKPFDGLGLIASVTYISTADLPWRAIDGTVYNLRILPKITASGTVYYEKGPISARASYTYKGDRFTGTNQNNGINTQIWDNPRSYLDASIGYKLRKWLEFRIEGQNLTNTRTYQFARQLDGLYGDENSRVDNAYEAGRTFSFGIRGSF